jgi:hypothetical protein
MKVYIYICLLLITVVLGLLSCEGEAGKGVTGPVDIKFNFTQDSSYQYYIKNNISLEQQVDEKNHITIHQNMTMVSTYKVLQAKGNSNKVAVTYDRITMSSGNPLFAFEYDSESDDGTDPIYEDLRHLIDKTFSMTVSDKGDLLATEQIQADDSVTANAYRFSDSSMRMIMLQTLYIYPGKPVQQGEAWQKTFSTSVGFANVKVACAYQLTSVKDGVAHIDMQGKLSTGKGRQPGSQNVHLDGTQKGTFEVEVATGLVISGKVTQQLSGEMDITGKNTPVQIDAGIFIIGTTKK